MREWKLKEIVKKSKITARVFVKYRFKKIKENKIYKTQNEFINYQSFLKWVNYGKYLERLNLKHKKCKKYFTSKPIK